MRMIILYCLIIVSLSACLGNTTYAVREDTINPNKRYYLTGGVTFLPPSLPGFSSTIWDSQASFGISSKDSPSHVGSGILVTSGATKKDPPSYPNKEVLYNLQKNRTKQENQRRADILAGTMEERWQEKVATAGGTEAMAKEIELYSGPLVLAYKTPEARAKWLKEDFYYFFGRQRARLRGLPDKTYQSAIVNGLECLRTDSYQRLATPLGEYAVRTGGGIQHSRNYACFIRHDLIPAILIHARLAAGDKIDFDLILKPVLESFAIDTSLPANHTTFDIMMATGIKGDAT